LLEISESSQIDEHLFSAEMSSETIGTFFSDHHIPKLGFGNKVPRYCITNQEIGKKKIKLFC